MNADFPLKMYNKIPCRIGYNYIRFQVDGDVRACCIAKYPIGEIRTKTWKVVWRSTAYSAFRSKMLKINTDHFHQYDPEFAFCLQCSHTPHNLESENLLQKARKKLNS